MMSLPVLAGLGDGLVVVLGILMALVVVIFAWWSTNVAETRVVGVIYLSTSHFNRLLQHLGQTPATATAAGHPTTFLAPSTDADTVNAVSQSRATSDAGRDTASSAVAVKHDVTPSVHGECPPGQHVTALSTNDASESREAADRDVYVDAQTDSAHCHENCTESGRLHATPDGMVLEGCTHLDDTVGGVWWAGEHTEDTRASGTGIRHRRLEPVNATTNTQLDDTDVRYTCRCSSSHVTQATRRDQESHQEESSEEEHMSLWGVGEGNNEMCSEGGSAAERGSQVGGTGAEGGIGGVSEVTDSLGEVRVQENTVSSQTLVSCDSPSFRTHRYMSDDTGASMAYSSDPQTDTVPEKCNREPCEGGRCTKSTVPEGGSAATDTEISRTVLRARQTGHVTVRLKYLDDQQRDVQTRLEDTVADFKRQHFAAELSANCTVRFVHNGQELCGDTATLRSFNVVDNSVIHCWLSRPVQPAPGSATGSSPVVTAAATQLDFSCLVLPLFAMLLLLVWYCRFSYHVYFSAVSTFCLVAMTLVFAVCMFVSLQFGDDAIDEVAM